MKNIYISISGRRMRFIQFIFLLSMMMLVGMMQGYTQETITSDPVDPVNVTYNSGSQLITITTSNSNGWTATRLSGNAWASPGSASGSSGGSFTVTYTENTGTSNRSAVYQITAEDCDPITVSIIQSKEGVAPIIQKISSTKTNGSYKSGEIIYIDVVYSDINTISLTGSNLSSDFYLNLNNGAKAYYDSQEAYDAGTDTKKITFKYTVGAGTGEDKDLLNVSSVSISGDVAVKDAAGNNANQTLPGTNNLANNNTLRIDNTSPTIASITSDATSTGWLKIGDAIHFTLTFTDAPEPLATVYGSYNGTALTWSTANSGVSYTATYTIQAGDPDQKSTPLQITGVYVIDAASTTGATKAGTDIQKNIDANKPVGIYDPSGGTGINVETHPTLTFDEVVYNHDGTSLTPSDLASKISFTRTTAPTGNIPFTASIDAENKIITIVPDKNLLGNSSYTISMAADQVEDVGENNNILTSVSFTTASTNITNTTINSSYNTIQTAFDEAAEEDNIQLLAAGSPFNETAELSTVNITLETVGSVSILNLTVSGSHTLTQSGGLTITGILNLSSVDDKVAIGANTLTLGGTIAGSGYLLGTGSSNVTVTGTGPLGSMNIEGQLNTFTVNRLTDGVVSLGNLAGSLPINTLSLQNGALELAFNSIIISNLSRINGTFLADDLASIEMTGSATGALVFSGVDPILGTLKLTTSGAVDVATSMNIVDAVINSGTLTNSQPVTFINITNSATYTMNADASVDVLLSIDNASGVVNVNNHTLILSGDITAVDETYINAGETSNLVFNGTAAYVLPVDITSLNNLTINRSLGVSMSENLDVKGALTLSNGNFTIGDHTLTINNPMTITSGVLVGGETSPTLYVKGSNAISLPAISLGTLVIDNSSTITITGAVTISDQLQLIRGTFNNSAYGITINENKTIVRSGGVMTNEPLGGTINIVYTGGSSLTTDKELGILNNTTNNVIVDNNGSGVILGANRPINNLTLTNGNFDFSDRILTMTGNLAVTSGSLLADADAQLILNGANAFTIPASITTLANLNINRDGGVSMGGDLLIEQVLDLTESFAIEGNRLTIKNAIQGDDTKLVAGGTSKITIAGAMSGVNLPAHLTTLSEFNINNTQGTTLQNNLSVGTLNLDLGKITLGTFDLSAATIDGGSSTTFVVANASLADYGKLIVTGTTSELLPIGYSVSGYTPVTITNDNPATISAAVEYITLMSDFSGPVPSPNYVKLQYQLTNSAPVNASVTFAWNAAEDFGSAPATPVVGRYNGTEWVPAGTTGGLGDKTITVSGVSSFSSFAIYGDKLPVVYVNSATGNDANTGEDSGAGLTGAKATITAALRAVKDDGNGKLIIADATTYNENVLARFNVEFETSGAFTISQTLTLNGAVITLDGDMTVVGTTTLTAATDKIIVGGNTLTLGDWTGSGFLTITNASNMVINGIVTSLNLDGGEINNLTAMEELTLLANLTVNGNLDIASNLNIVANTLTLSGGFAGDGFLIGVGTSNLTLGGTGNIASLNVDGSFDYFIINRTGNTISLGLGNFVEFNAIDLQSGTLDLNGSFVDVNTLDIEENTLVLNQGYLSIATAYSRTSGLFQGDAGASLAFGGSITGEIRFEDLYQNLSDFSSTSSGTITLGTPLTVATDVVINGGTFTTANGADLTVTGTLSVYESSSLSTAANLNVGTMNNLGGITLGGTSTITDALTMGSIDPPIAATLNFTGQSLTLGGTINVLGTSTFTTNAASNLTLTTGTDAWDLHSSINLLNNLTIDRAVGVNMTGALNVNGTLILTSGDFTVGSNTLTINNALAGTATNLKSDASSSLVVAGTGEGIHIPALVNLLNLTINNTNGAEVDGGITIANKLTLTNGTLAGSGNLIFPNGKYIERSGGLLGAAPQFGSSINVEYTGSGVIATGYEIPAGSSVSTNVIVNNGGSGVTESDDLTLNNLTLTSGGFAIGALHTLTLNGLLAVTSGSLTGGSSSSLILGGTTSFALPNSIATLSNLTIDRSGGVTLQGDISIEGSLYLTSGNFNLSNYGLTIKSPIQGTVANLIETSSSSITIAGTVPGILIPSNVTELNNLTLNNINGTALQGPLSLSSLTLTDGLLTLGAHNLTTTSVSGYSGSSFIIADATLAGRFSMTGVTSSVIMPVGYGSGSYTPLQVSNSTSADFSIAIKQINDMGDFAYPVPSPDFVDLQWDLSRVGSGAAEVTFNWNALEGDAVSAKEVGHYAGGSVWLAAGTTGTPTATSVTVSNITEFSPFAAYGDRLATVYVDAINGDDSNTGESATAVDGTGPKKTINEAYNVVTGDGTGKLIIADGTSYTENLTVSKTLTFETSGAFTLDGNLAVSGTHVITMVGDMSVTGTLNLAAAGDKISIGANDLSVGGAWTGNGYLVGGATSDLSLGGAVTNFNLEGNELNDLDISGAGTVTLNTDFIVNGTLTLLEGTTEPFDVLAIGSNTLTLNGDISGDGYLLGTSASNVTISGTGAFGFANIIGELHTFTINRASETITLGICDFPLPVNTLNLTAGELALGGNYLQINGTNSRTAGTFNDDGSSTLEFTGSTSGDLYFTGVTPSLGELDVNSSGTFDVKTAMSIGAAVVNSGVLNTSEVVAFGSISNMSTINLGANASVTGLFSLADVAAAFNVGANTFTFNGEITGTDFGTLNAGSTSSLVFNGEDLMVFNLPSNIGELYNLTINRTLATETEAGVNLTHDLDVKNVLTLTAGDFFLNDNKLTINNAMGGTLGNLKAMSQTSVVVAGNGSGIHIPALGNLKDLIINNSYGATLDGGISIFNQLTLTLGVLSGSDYLTMNNGTTIERSGGSLTADPTFFASINVNYTGASALITGFELPIGTIETNVTVNNGGLGVTLNRNSTIHNLTLTNGNFDFSDLSLTMTGDLTVTTGSMLADKDAQLMLNGTNAFTIPASIFELANLIINRTGGVSMGGDLLVDQILNLTQTFNIGSHRLTLKNGIQGDDTKLVADENSSITIMGTIAGITVPAHITNLNNLTLNNPGGTVLQGDLELSTLNLTSGKLALGLFDLSTGPITGGSSSSFVIANSSNPANGRLILKNVSTTTNVPIGFSSSFYTPMSIGNAGDAADFTLALKNADNLTDFESGTLPTPVDTYVRLQWEIARSGEGKAEVTFNFPDQGYGFAPTFAGRYNLAEWVPAGTISAATATSLTLSEIEDFSNFALYTGTPVIVWEEPTDIVYGTLLSAAQLNAKAYDPMTYPGSSPVEVSGTFTYTPSIGTKLYVGDDQTLSVSFASADGFNNPEDAEVKIDVNQKPITVTAPEDITKVYDGNTTATAVTIIAPGLAPGDSKGTEAILTYNNKIVAENKTVTPSGIVIVEDVTDRTSNYDITYVNATDAAITLKSLTVTAPALITKVYDGTTVATGTTSVDGLVAGDSKGTEATLTYNNKLVATNKTVTPSAIVIVDGLSADMTANYDITYVNATDAAITLKSLTVTAPALITKVYDGTTVATGTTSVDGLVAGDSKGTEATLTYNNKLVATNKTVTPSAIVIIDGLSADMTANYNISYVNATDAAITAKELTISGTFTAFNKIYDGNTTATINNNSLNLVGIVNPDIVTLSPVAAFANATVGDNKTVSLTASSSLAGADNTNYSLSLTGAPTTTASILPDNTPVITNADGSAASITAIEGDQRAYKVTNRGTGFSYVWSFVDGAGTNVFLSVTNTSQVEIEWNQTKTLRVTESYDDGSGGLPEIVRTGDLIVTVTQIALKGTIKYNRNNGSHNAVEGVTVKLKNGATILSTTTTDASGYFEFMTVDGSTNTIEVTTAIPWGGGNSTDALAIQRRSIAGYPDFWKPANFDFNFRDKVGDVNANAWPNATDALMVKRRAIQLINSFTAGDWAFFIPGTTPATDRFFSNTNALTATMAYTHSSPTTLNILAMTYGDVNSSYNPVPPAKSYAPVASDQVTYVKEKQLVELPVILESPVEIGAITAYIKYDSQLIDVKGLKTDIPEFLFNINDGFISIAYSNADASMIPSDGELFRLVFEVKQEIHEWDDLFSIDSRTQIADMNCSEIDNAYFKIDRLDTRVNGSSEKYDFSCYPNPVRDLVNVRFALCESGHVSIVLFNSMGESMVQLMNEKLDAGKHHLQFNPEQYGLPNGTYYFRITAAGENTSFSKVEQVVYMK